jgi:hypothetical protein
MWVAAQAVVEYGGLTSSRVVGSPGSGVDRIVNAITNASATDYLVGAVAQVTRIVIGV